MTAIKDTQFSFIVNFDSTDKVYVFAITDSTMDNAEVIRIWFTKKFQANAFKNWFNLQCDSFKLGVIMKSDFIMADTKTQVAACRAFKSNKEALAAV